MKNINQKSILLANIIIGFSAVASANCPNPTQQAALKSRAVTNYIYVNASQCSREPGFSNLHAQYVSLRNSHVAYFNRQARETERFAGEDQSNEVSAMYAVQREFHKNIASAPARCAEIRDLISNLQSAGSEAELDRRIQAVTAVDAEPIAGCSSARVASAEPVSRFNGEDSLPAEASDVPRTPSYSSGGSNSRNVSSVEGQPSFTQEPNAGVGALKIIASLYAPANLADRCAPTQVDFFDVNGDFFDIYNSMSQQSRPFYSQARRNPTWNGSEMSLITSDCSSLVSASIGAGGLKITEDEEINEIGNLPTTHTMLNWFENPSSNNCFEAVEFRRDEPAIQVGDIYVYSVGAHVEIVTHVGSEEDPLGFSTSVDINGQALSSQQRFSASDCREYGVLGKSGDGGNGFLRKIISAQISDTSRGPYLRANQIQGKMLALACRAHFSGESQTAYISDGGGRQGLFRIKRDADGNIPSACVSELEIVHKGYDSVRACFASEE